jgi:hypothetical protein
MTGLTTMMGTCDPKIYRRIRRNKMNRHKQLRTVMEQSMTYSTCICIDVWLVYGWNLTE